MSLLPKNSCFITKGPQICLPVPAMFNYIHDTMFLRIRRLLAFNRRISWKGFNVLGFKGSFSITWVLH